MVQIPAFLFWLPCTQRIDWLILTSRSLTSHIIIYENFYSDLCLLYCPSS